jgi:hypothetical protein
MAGELEAQTILDVVPAAQRNRDRWPVEYHTPDVEHFDVVTAETTVSTTGGAFFTMRTDPITFNIYLQGGMVSGGLGNKTIDEILLFNKSQGTNGTWVGSNEQTLIITVTGNGTATDGVLDPIFNLQNAVASVGSAGANTFPTATNLNGKTCYLMLGAFIEKGFAPSSIGNFTVGLCWGSYNINRY